MRQASVRAAQAGPHEDPYRPRGPQRVESGGRAVSAESAESVERGTR